MKHKMIVFSTLSNQQKEVFFGIFVRKNSVFTYDQLTDTYVTQFSTDVNLLKNQGEIKRSSSQLKIQGNYQFDSKIQSKCEVAQKNLSFKQPVFMQPTYKMKNMNQLFDKIDDNDAEIMDLSNIEPKREALDEGSHSHLNSNEGLNQIIYQKKNVTQQNIKEKDFFQISKKDIDQKIQDLEVNNKYKLMAKSQAQNKPQAKQEAIKQRPNSLDNKLIKQKPTQNEKLQKLSLNIQQNSQNSTQVQKKKINYLDLLNDHKGDLLQKLKSSAENSKLLQKDKPQQLHTKLVVKGKQVQFVQEQTKQPNSPNAPVVNLDGEKALSSQQDFTVDQPDFDIPQPTLLNDKQDYKIISIEPTSMKPQPFDLQAIQQDDLEQVQQYSNNLNKSQLVQIDEEFQTTPKQTVQQQYPQIWLQYQLDQIKDECFHLDYLTSQQLQLILHNFHQSNQQLLCQLKNQQSNEKPNSNNTQTEPTRNDILQALTSGEKVQLLWIKYNEKHIQQQIQTNKQSGGTLLHYSKQFQLSSILACYLANLCLNDNNYLFFTLNKLLHNQLINLIIFSSIFTYSVQVASLIESKIINVDQLISLVNKSFIDFQQNKQVNQDCKNFIVFLSKKCPQVKQSGIQFIKLYNYTFQFLTETKLCSYSKLIDEVKIINDNKSIQPLQLQNIQKVNTQKTNKSVNRSALNYSNISNTTNTKTINFINAIDNFNQNLCLDKNQYITAEKGLVSILPSLISQLNTQTQSKVNAKLLQNIGQFINLDEFRQLCQYDNVIPVQCVYDFCVWLIGQCGQ